MTWLPIVGLTPDPDRVPACDSAIVLVPQTTPRDPDDIPYPIRGHEGIGVTVPWGRRLWWKVCGYFTDQYSGRF